MTTAPDTILHHGLFTTLDRSIPDASAVAIKDGKFLAVGHDREIMALADPTTKVVDLKGRRVLPGLIDNHTHVIRGGLNFNMELRWDGVRSLADAMDMLKRQVAITPPPQWVRVVGGFTEHQFEEKRLPTLEEINMVAPDTPVFLLHLYDRALLNAAALSAVGFMKDTPAPPGSEIERDANGNPTGLLLAKPNAGILYATLAKGPKLPFDYQVNLTRHFMRELNRLGVTGVIDANGGFQNYPEDYAVIQKLADEGQMTVRLAYNLFTQKPKEEKEDFLNWTSSVKYKQGDDYFRHNGAGEMLVFSAADFEDFRQPRPDMPAEMEGELDEVVRILADNRWPWRLHATYDETISRALDVFEKVNQDIPLDGLNWFFDHAETISDQSIDRIAALGGGIAVQHRMAYQGEYFVERYRPGAAEAAPPIARMAVQTRNGVVDIAVADEAEAVAVAKTYLAYFQGPLKDWTAPDQRRMRHIVPENRLRTYEVRDVIRTLADEGTVLELRRDFGRTMVTALIRLEGRTVGVLANDPKHLGGAVDSDGSDKGARFMQLCDAFDVPVVNFCDTPGIMVGPEAEKTALVRHAARMFLTSSNMTVPYFTVVLRKAYGLGQSAMAGGNYRAPYFYVSWPTGEFAPMGIEGQVKLGFRAELAATENPEERLRFFEEMVAKAYETGKALHRSTNFMVDDVIDPAETRTWIVNLLAAIRPAPARTGKKRPMIDAW